MYTSDQTTGHEARKPTDADRYVGQQVRQGRRESGLTQETLAGLLGVTFQQIQKYEAGHSRLSAGRLREVAIALKKPIDYFYEPLDMKVEQCSETERSLKVRDLQRDAKKLIESLGDLDDLQVVVHMLDALKPRMSAAC